MSEPDHPATAEWFARWLMVQAAWPSAAVCIAFVTMPFSLRADPPLFAAIAGSVALAAGLATLALSALLLFDAVLFRLMASHPTELAGCQAIDDLLARMSLKPIAGSTRSLTERIAGTRTLVRNQRTAFAACAVGFGALILAALS